MRGDRRTGGAVRYRLAAELSNRWKAWLGLALAIGLAGGIALAAAAGARRTASAYSRLLDSVEQEDAFVAPVSPDGRYNDIENPILLDAARLPQVERSAGFAQLLTAYGTKITEAAFNEGLGSLALINGSGYEFDRAKILDGRAPDRHKVNETLINPQFADAHRLEVGSRFPMTIISSDVLDASLANGTDYDGPVGHETMIVTGIGKFARDIVPTTVNDESPISYVTPAFFAKYPWSLVNYGSVVRLRPGADVEQFHADVIRIADGYGVPAQQVYFTAQRDRTETVTRAVRPQALALALLALVVALAAFLVGGQALSRQVFVDSTDSPVLGAVGMTRHQRFALAITRVAIVSGAGAALAVVLAIAASPLFPIGLARDAEPNAGLSFDAVVLVGGFVVILIGFIARGAFPAWTGASATPGTLGIAEPERARPSRVAERLSQSGFRPARVIGVRMAFEAGHGRTAVPVRSALVTTALAIAAVAAVFTFSTNLNRLAETPERYGWGWTGSVGFGFDPLPSDVTTRLVDNPKISAVAGANYGTLDVAGRAIPLVTYDKLKGNVGPVILEGRAPRGDRELALGTRTLRESGLSLGDRVPVRIGGQHGTMRIVGRAVFPRLGAGSFTPTDLGQGATMTQGALTKLGIDTTDPSNTDDPDAALFRLLHACRTRRVVRHGGVERESRPGRPPQ